VKLSLLPRRGVYRAADRVPTMVAKCRSWGYIIYRAADRVPTPMKAAPARMHSRHAPDLARAKSGNVPVMGTARMLAKYLTEGSRLTPHTTTGAVRSGCGLCYVCTLAGRECEQRGTSFGCYGSTP